MILELCTVYSQEIRGLLAFLLLTHRRVSR
jgi:hypothetical protein